MKQISRRWPDPTSSQKVILCLWSVIAVHRLILDFLLWYHGSSIQEAGWRALNAIIIPAGILAVTAVEVFFQPVVYDDGDALVVCKRSKRQIRIPFSNICRVSYAGHGDGIDTVTLKFFEPNEFGSSLRFKVRSEFPSPPHCGIADDLHRRSRCCKDGDAHTQATT